MKHIGFLQKIRYDKNDYVTKKGGYFIYEKYQAKNSM